jgi:hypothetical protein
MTGGPIPSGKRLLTPREAAEALGIDDRLLRAMRQSGFLTAVTLPGPRGHHRFRAPEIEAHAAVRDQYAGATS